MITRALAGISLVAVLSAGAQPAFEIADVHVSPRVSERLRIENMPGGVFQPAGMRSTTPPCLT